MNSIFTREVPVLLGICNHRGELGVVGALDLFMDQAALHEEALGCGIVPMEKDGLFWIIGRNRIRFIDTPHLMDRVKVSTWIPKPSRLYIERQYKVESPDGRLLVLGETQWLPATTGCKQILPVDRFLPDNYDFSVPPVFAEKMQKISKDFLPEQEIGCYTVSPVDIDYIAHMNNAAYGRTIMNFVPGKFLDEHPLELIEIFYHKQCLEGDVLKVYRRDIQGGWEMGAYNGDGICVMTARLTFKGV